MNDQVPADDRGLTLGVGLFETVLVQDSRPVLWAAHLERLARGCLHLGLPAPEPAACAEAARRALDQAGLRDARAALRLTWTGGSGARGLAGPGEPAPRLLASAASAAPPPATLSLALVSVRRNATSPAARLKTLSYLDNVAARREAVAAGAEEALMLSTDGTLACAAAANLFWFAGGDLHTPPLACGVLDGIVRELTIRRARELGLTVREAAAGPQALVACDGAFLTNSLIGAVAVSSLDGAPLTQPAAHAGLLAALAPDAMAAGCAERF